MPRPDLQAMLSEARQVTSVSQIARCLDRICRFSGRVPFYSVLQHSYVVGRCVEDINPDWAVYGFLHDAGEMFIGDVPSPAKPTSLALMEERLLATIYAQLGIPQPTNEIKEAVAVADHAAVCAEWRILKPEPVSDWQPDVDDELARRLTRSIATGDLYANIRGQFVDECEAALPCAIPTGTAAVEACLPDGFNMADDAPTFTRDIIALHKETARLKARLAEPVVSVQTIQTDHDVAAECLALHLTVLDDPMDDPAEADAAPRPDPMVHFMPDDLFATARDVAILGTVLTASTDADAVEVQFRVLDRYNRDQLPFFDTGDEADNGWSPALRLEGCDVQALAPGIRSILAGLTSLLVDTMSPLPRVPAQIAAEGPDSNPQPQEAAHA
jgi:hypothetical protein